MCFTQRKGLWYAHDDACVTCVEVSNQWLLNYDEFTPYMFMFKQQCKNSTMHIQVSKVSKPMRMRRAYAKERVVNP